MKIQDSKNVKDISFNFKPLNEAQLSLLTRWLNYKHLQEWWNSGEITLENVREKYLPRIIGSDSARPYIIYLDEIPIGYIQYYYVSAGDPNWWPDEPGRDVIGIDQFIADINLLDKGYGTMMITQFIRYLDNEITISEVRVDPRPDNLRAIRCYEKVGFRKIQNIVTPDGPAIMMTLKNTKDLLP